MSVFNNILGAINTGLGVYGGVQSALQQGNAGACRAPVGCFQCKMTGQGDIAGCLDALWVELLRIKAAGNSAASLQAYQSALQAISNPQLFRQSDTYLTNSKSWMRTHMSEFEALIASGQTQPQANNNNTGGSGGQAGGVPISSTQLIDGVPNSYLVMGGFALLGIVLYTRK